MPRFILMAVLAILPMGVSAARLMLRDGTVVYGQFISGTSQSITFQDEDGARRRFNVDQIQTIDFGGSNTSSGRYNQPGADQYGQQQRLYDLSDRGGSYAYRSEQRYGVEWAALQPGTEISVRSDETISSQSAVQGRTYPATITRDVLDSNGTVVIPRGSPGALMIRRINQGGGLSGGSFVLDLDSVTVNGRRYLVSTSDIEQRNANGIGANRRTAEMVGGGTALGTLVGAVAGGGKGAAIGAIAGALAGGGAEVLTKGNEIRVPAETVLNFRLDQPLHLREAR